MNPEEIKADQLETYCADLARKLMKDHEKRFADRTRSVKEAAAGLANAGGRLSSGVKNAWGTMDKQASEYAMRLAQTIQENAQNLSRKEPAPTYQDVEAFHEDAVKTLNDIILTVRRYVPKLYRMLKPEMATINSSLTRLEKSITDLGNALDGSPGLKLESLDRDVKALREKQAELHRVESEERTEQTLLETGLAREKEYQSKIQELLIAPEFLELRRYEDSLKQKEDEIKQLLQPLTKPLLKLERAAAAKQTAAIDVKALRDLVESPIETVVTGQRFANMQLLDRLEENLAQGKLEILDRRRRKAQEAIIAMKQGALDRARDEYLALQANSQETLRQLKSKGLLGIRDELDQEMEMIHNQIADITARKQELQRRKDDLDKAVSKLKVSIESQVNKVAHEAVTITLSK